MPGCLRHITRSLDVIRTEVGDRRQGYLRVVTRHDAMPGGCELEGTGVCEKGTMGGKNEEGSSTIKREESDIFLPRFVSPVKLSKLGPEPPTSPIIYRTVIKLCC